MVGASGKIFNTSSWVSDSDGELSLIPIFSFYGKNNPDEALITTERSRNDLLIHLSGGCLLIESVARSIAF